MSRSMTNVERRNARRSDQRSHQRALRQQRRIQSPKAVPWTDLHEGVVIDVNLTFQEDQRQWKRRPAVVVAVLGREVEVYECTTRLRQHPHLIVLHDWRDCGLSQSTAVWTRRRRIDRSHILGVVGVLSDSDHTRLRRITDLLR